MLLLFALVYSLQRTIDAAPASITPSYLSSSNTTSNSPNDPTDCTCPDLRSTWNIVWNCLATIFACAWVSVHPNIPEPGRKEWQVALIRSELMIWTIIAPEMMIFWAIRQWVGSRKLLRQYQDTYPIWTKTHGYFLQMGGFMLFHGSRKIGVLSPERLAALSEERIIEFPTITEEEIDDRSKGDALSKTLVLGQTTWFIAQCITRRAEDLAMTELELVTLAFAALNGFMYFFWWNKPLDVRTTVPVYLLDQPLPEKAPSEVTLSPSRPAGPKSEDHWVWSIHEHFGRIIVNMLLKLFVVWPFQAVTTVLSRLGDMAEFAGRSNTVDENATTVHYFYAMNTTDKDRNHILAVVSLIGVIFGVIHAVGWNFQFPTEVEAALWKACSVIVTVVPFLMIIPVGCQSVYFQTETFCLERFTEDVGIVTTTLGIYVGLPIYIIARIILLTEALITLRNLPSGALLEVEWTSFLPHV